MSFRQDLTSTAGLRNAYRPGLQGLRSTDRTRVRAMDRRLLRGSADLDHALSSLFPDAHRWDYVVAYRTTKAEHLYWIEVHPARGEKTVTEVLSKLRWLQSWLNGDGRRLKTYTRTFVWIASGRTAFQQNSPQGKRLAMSGILLADRRFQVGR